MTDDTQKLNTSHKTQETKDKSVHVPKKQQNPFIIISFYLTIFPFSVTHLF